MKYAPIALLLVLSACGQKPDEATTPPTNEVAVDPNLSPVSFTQCAACHSVEPGTNGLGPSLHGVVGRKAASLDKFYYSEAMKASGLTWDEATLDKYIATPMAVVPGNRMSFAGQPDPAKRKEIIAWLKKNS
jgi:cytochrome c